MSIIGKTIQWNDGYHEENTTIIGEVVDIVGQCMIVLREGGELTTVGMHNLGCGDVKVIPTPPPHDRDELAKELEEIKLVLRGTLPANPVFTASFTALQLAQQLRQEHLNRVAETSPPVDPIANQRIADLTDQLEKVTKELQARKWIQADDHDTLLGRVKNALRISADDHDQFSEQLGRIQQDISTARQLLGIKGGVWASDHGPFSEAVGKLCDELAAARGWRTLAEGVSEMLNVDRYERFDADDNGFVLRSPVDVSVDVFAKIKELSDARRELGQRASDLDKALSGPGGKSFGARSWGSMLDEVGALAIAGLDAFTKKEAAPTELARIRDDLATELAQSRAELAEVTAVLLDTLGLSPDADVEVACKLPHSDRTWRARYRAKQEAMNESARTEVANKLFNLRRLAATALRLPGSIDSAAAQVSGSTIDLAIVDACERMVAQVSELQTDRDGSSSSAAHGSLAVARIRDDLAKEMTAHLETKQELAEARRALAELEATAMDYGERRAKACEAAKATLFDFRGAIANALKFDPRTDQALDRTWDASLVALAAARTLRAEAATEQCDRLTPDQVALLRLPSMDGLVWRSGGGLLQSTCTGTEHQPEYLNCSLLDTAISALRMQHEDLKAMDSVLRANHEAAMAAMNLEHIDVLLDGPPGPEAGRFVEVEGPDGRSVAAGEWIDPVRYEQSTGSATTFWRLRIPRYARSTEVTEVTEAVVMLDEQIKRRTRIIADTWGGPGTQTARLKEQVDELHKLRNELISSSLWRGNLVDTAKRKANSALPTANEDDRDILKDYR